MPVNSKKWAYTFGMSGPMRMATLGQSMALNGEIGMVATKYATLFNLSEKTHTLGGTLSARGT